MLVRDIKKWSIAVMIPLILVFYPIVTVIPYVLKLPSRPISMTYRFIYMVASLVILALSIMWMKRTYINKKLFPLIIFWCLYCIRLFYDLTIRDIDIYESDSYFYMFGILGTFVPILAMAFSYELVSKDKALKTLFLFLVVSNLVLMFMILKSGIGISSILVNRAMVLGEGDAAIINPIVLSRYGGLLFVMSIFFTWHTKNIIIHKLIAYAGAGLGFICLLIGASRGPIVSALLIVLIQSILLLYHNRRNWYFLFNRLLISLLVLIGGAIYFIPKILALKEVAIIDRFTKFEKKGLEQEVRFFQWKESFEQILESPIIGERMVERLYGFYPHNIYIEIMLATGIIGSFFILVSLILSFRNALYEIKVNSVYQVIHFLFWVYMIFGLTGVNIHTSPQFWILFTMTLFRYKKSINIYNS